MMVGMIVQELLITRRTALLLELISPTSTDNVAAVGEDANSCITEASSSGDETEAGNGAGNGNGVDTESATNAATPEEVAAAAKAERLRAVKDLKCMQMMYRNYHDMYLWQCLQPKELEHPTAFHKAMCGARVLQEFALEGVIEFHAFTPPLEARACV